MGERPIRAMHGYHPDDPQSYAALLTNQPTLPPGITAIPHICKLMEQHALAAQQALAPRQPLPATLATSHSLAA